MCVCVREREQAIMSLPRGARLVQGPRTHCWVIAATAGPTMPKRGRRKVQQARTTHVARTMVVRYSGHKSSSLGRSDGSPATSLRSTACEVGDGVEPGRRREQPAVHSHRDDRPSPGAALGRQEVIELESEEADDGEGHVPPEEPVAGGVNGCQRLPGTGAAKHCEAPLPSARGRAMRPASRPGGEARSHAPEWRRRTRE